MVRIEQLPCEERHERALAALMVEVVADNASVSFLHPLSHGTARAFWRQSLELAEQGKRIVFGAFEDGSLLGTVTLNLDTPENQPHRAEIAKMIVAKSARRRGIAARLLGAAETEARARGRWLVTLDTVPGEAGERLYVRLGYVRAGEIPDYALRPDRTLSATAIYYKRLT